MSIRPSALPPHPLDLAGSIKIRLGLEASEAIMANGDYHLAVITHPDATSPDDCAGRLILTCLPTDKIALNIAYRALEKHRAALAKKTT